MLERPIHRHDTDLSRLRHQLFRRRRGDPGRRPLGEVRKLRRERSLLFTIINAVTDPIMLTDTEGRLILTKRASSLRHHPGQIALPGGKVDPGDADTVAAINASSTALKTFVAVSVMKGLGVPLAAQMT